MWELLENLKRQLLALWAETEKLEEADIPTPEPKKSPREVLYESAKSFIGKDASPFNEAPNALSCAESVSEIVHQTFKDFPIEGKNVLYTPYLLNKLKAHPKFKGTLNLDCGNIIISPTGQGNGNLSNGHAGIIGKKGKIMSSDSRDGIWKENYSISSWVARYRTRGGFPIFVVQRTEH